MISELLISMILLGGLSDWIYDKFRPEEDMRQRIIRYGPRNNEYSKLLEKEKQALAQANWEVTRAIQRRERTLPELRPGDVTSYTDQASILSPFSYLKSPRRIVGPKYKVKLPSHHPLQRELANLDLHLEKGTWLWTSAAILGVGVTAYVLSSPNYSKKAKENVGGGLFVLGLYETQGIPQEFRARKKNRGIEGRINKANIMIKGYNNRAYQINEKVEIADEHKKEYSNVYSKLSLTSKSLGRKVNSCSCSDEAKLLVGGWKEVEDLISVGYLEPNSFEERARQVIKKADTYAAIATTREVAVRGIDGEMKSVMKEASKARSFVYANDRFVEYKTRIMLDGYITELGLIGKLCRCVDVRTCGRMFGIWDNGVATVLYRVESDIRKNQRKLAVIKGAVGLADFFSPGPLKIMGWLKKIAKGRKVLGGAAKVRRVK